MAGRPTAPAPHRGDGEKPAGNVKVTREDWVNAAIAVLIRDGVSQVKVLNLAQGLGVSRSSFYWYFTSRRELLDALLAHWRDRNTAAMVAQAEAPAATITASVCNVFRCTANPALFDTALDFAIRDWARRNPSVRAALIASDAEREAALAAMFRRHRYPAPEAETRAKVLYFMQLGYDFAGPAEDPETRTARVPDYLRIFTGREPKAEEIEDFTAYARQFRRFG